MAARAREAPARRRALGWTIAKWAGIALATVVALAAAFLLWLNTEAGHRFIVDKINAMETASGLKVHVGRIEGSVFGRLTVHDLSLADPRGTFASAPRAELDYSPFAYLIGGRIEIRDLDIPEARLDRAPRLRPGDPNAPFLPDIHLDLARLHIGRLTVAPAVTGRRHLLSLDGRVTIADGRAQVRLDAGTLRAPGLAGGDRLHLVLDAVPSANRLDLDLDLRGPGDGLVAGLIGTDKAVAATLNGRGSWASWQGRARAALAGQALADLAVTGRDGRFTVDGTLRPGLVLQGPAQRLAEPLARVNLVASLVQRRADIRFRLRSRVLALAAEGRLDLAANRYENLRIAGRLLEPGAIAPDLAGRDVNLAVILNGAFATPGVLYELRAASLTLGGTTIEGLRAIGNARVRAGDIVVPVSARATRILGFDAVAGGAIADVRLDGELGIAGTRLVSDNMILRSDRIDARLALAFDLAAGRYLAAVQGRVDAYLVNGVGLFSVTTNLDMTSGPGGFGLRGRFAARTLRLTNETIRGLLGGVGTVTANIVMVPSGVITVSDVRLAAPRLRVRTGGGVYRPDGTIDLRLAGDSSDYGPLAVTVTGRASAPRIVLAAASPGYGLVNLTATVSATGNGWALAAAGDSPYGRFTANVVIRSSGNRMVIAVDPLVYAGITFRGTLTRTASAPFAGALALEGQGLTGNVTLAAAGGRQQVIIAATADSARTPGADPIIVQRGRVQATITLPADGRGPIDVVGVAELAGLASGDLFVQHARVEVDYAGGNGTARLFAEGRRGVSFRISASGRRRDDPRLGDRASIAMQGQINNIPFRLDHPAQLVRVRTATSDEWYMVPATISFPQGRVRLAGRYGNGTVIQTRLDNLDLAIVNAFSPGLGIGGRASGSLDFAQPADGAFPRAEARLNVTGFTRTGIAVRSSPVDLFIAGNLTPEGGAAGAIVRRGGAIVGRAQVRLQPLGPAAGSWRDRLLAAPLAGGIRYNGPADVPMSFASLPGHQLTGPLGLAADFSGRVDNPQFSDGIVRANNLVYVNETYGTRVTNLAVDGRFSGSELRINRLAGRAGNGTITGSGTIGLSSAAGYPTDLRLDFQNARLARSDDLGATATGNLRITNNREGSWIRGALDLGEVRYQIVRQAAAEIPQLAGVRRRGEPLPDPNAQRADARVPSVWQLDIELRANNRIYVSGMGMESEWRTADLRARGTTTTLELVGQVRMIRGTLGLAGRRFRFDHGEVTFEGARPSRLNLVATADIESVEVGIVIAGSSLNPQISFTSSPSLPQDEVVSRILFGSSVTQISALQAVQLAASLQSLSGGGGGLNPLGRLRSATGIDRLRIIDADTATGRGTAVAAGMYLSDDIYVEIITDAKGYTATQIEISLTRTLSLLSQFGSNSGTNVNLRYNRDY